MNAIAAGLGADIDDRVSRARCLGIKNLVAADQAQGKRIDQRIAGVTALELYFAAHVRNTETVAVRGDSADYAFHHRMVLVQGRFVEAGLSGDRSEAQGIHHRDRARAHGEDVAEDATDTRCRALERLDKRWVIVRLDLECAGPAVTDVDDARVLAGPLHNALAASGQALQVNARGLIRAVLAPHHAKDAQLGERRRPAQRLQDAPVFLRRDTVVAQ